MNKITLQEFQYKFHKVLHQVKDQTYLVYRELDSISKIVSLIR